MNFFKKYFVPHKENDYKPHLFRDISVLVFFSISVLLFIVTVSGRTILVGTDLTALVLPKVLVDYANQDRLAENYHSLAINTTLEKAAQMKADDMALKGYFAHKSPDGHTPWYWFGQAGYNFSYAGENLAVNFIDSVDVNQAWMNSPGHRANILNGNFTEIGIATAQGIYNGRPTIFVVQLFGRPAEKEVTVLPVISTTTPKKVDSTLVTKATTSAVLSETISNVDESADSNNLYIAVEKKSLPANSSPTEQYSTFWQRMLLSPNKSLSIAYLILSLIIIFGLSLLVFVEIKRQHPRLILLGLGLIVVMFGLLYLYQSVLFAPLLIA